MQEQLDELLQGANSLEQQVEIANRWLDENSRSNPELARLLLERLLPEAKKEKNAWAQAWLHFNLGWFYIDETDSDKAIPLLESVCEDFETLGDKVGQARSLNALGAAYSTQSLFDTALDLYRKSWDLGNEIGRPDIAGSAGFNVALCLLEIEEAEEALEVIGHCRRHYSFASYNEALFLVREGETYLKLSRLEEAEKAFMEAIGVSSSLDNLLDARQGLAETYLRMNRLEEVEELVNEGLRDTPVLAKHAGAILFKLTEARLFLLKEEPYRAVESAKEARLKAIAQGSKAREVESEYLLFQAYKKAQEFEESLLALERYSEIRESLRSEQTTRRMVGLQSERYRREARYFETLYRQIAAIGEIGHKIASHLDFEATLDVIHSTINDLMDAETVVLALVDEEHHRLDYPFVMVRGKRQKPYSCSLDAESFGCYCVKNRSPIIIGDLPAEYPQYVTSYQNLEHKGRPELSLAYIPLFFEDRVVGVLSVQSSRPHAYEQQKVEILRAIGGYMAIAIENSRLFKRVQHLAASDVLTGLPNRRHLMQELEKCYQDAVNRKQITGVILIDVDHFKRVNDTYGHDIGDLALCALADALSKKVRKTDMVGRLGGEEFLVIAPRTDPKCALLLAKRLRETLEDLVTPLPKGELRMTASFGVSVIVSTDKDCHAALKRADKALYKAKDAGRNQVVHQFTDEPKET